MHCSAALQVTMAFDAPRPGQGVQLVPHDSALVSSSHAAAAPVPHWCVPELQVKPQPSGLPPQVAVELAGPEGQGVHDAPQELTLVSLRHAEPQA